MFKNDMIGRWYTLLIISTVIIKGHKCNTLGTSLAEPSRHSRVNGRIVKMNSGNRPERIICIGEGFQADPVDCSIFYRCIKASSGKYTVLRFQCGPGTVYDPDTEVCNHPYSTKRSECRSRRPIEFITVPFEQIGDNDIEPSMQELPLPISTKKPIYTKQTSVFTSSPIHYPPNMPVLTQNVNYGSSASIYLDETTVKPQRSTRTTEFPTSEISIVSTPYSLTTASNQYRTTISSSKIEKYGNKCTYDGFLGDSEDCRKFYRCVNNQKGGFMKYEFMCSESTIWDDDIQSCNHPWAVRRSRCGHDTSVHDSLSKFGQDYLQRNKLINEAQSPDPVTQNEAEISSTLPTPNQTNYGDRTNMDKVSDWVNHTDINSGIINSQTQTQTKHKDVEKQAQLMPIYLNPLSSTPTQYESITKSSTHIFHQVKEDSVRITNYPNINPKDPCIKSGFMGDPNDCRKFYRCVENGRGGYTKHEFSCGEGTAWDKNIDSCNHVWMVKECGGKILTNSSISDKKVVGNMYTTDVSNIISDEIGYNVGSQQNDKRQQITAKPTIILRETTVTPLKPSVLNISQEICKSAGYIGSKEDCKRFYRCVENEKGGYSKFEYMCDEGTVWDPNIEACNHAWVVKHCQVNFKNETKLSTPTTEATISFIQTTVLSSIINNDYDIGYVSSNYSETTPKALTTNKVQISTDNSCKENGFMADSYDCRKFYRCVDNEKGGFIRFEYLCGEGTVWDSNITACNHFWAVKKCVNSVSTVSNETVPLQPPPLENVEHIDNGYFTQIHEDVIKTTAKTTFLNSETKASTIKNKFNSCANSGFIGDEIDCKKFYRCVANGDGSYMRYDFSCGEGTVWDPEIEACNYAWAVKNCAGTFDKQHEVINVQSSTIQTTKDETDNSYSTHPYNWTDIPLQNTIASSTYKIPISDKYRECISAGFLADKNNCKIYYRCVDNGQGGFTRYEFSCGDDTAWDENIEACNHASFVKDCGTISKNISSTSVVTTTYSINTVNFEESTSRYPQNENPTTNKTTYANDTCITEGFYGNYEDCKKFYRCVNNQQGGFLKYEFSCGEGTFWDQNIQACNHASNNKVNCSKISTTNTTSINEPPATAIEQSNIESHTTVHIEESSTKKNTDLEHNTKVVCLAEGFYPHPNDCKKFFRCVDNGAGEYIKIDFTCGDGTIWVQAIHACDHKNDKSVCSTELSSEKEIHVTTTTIATSSDISTIQQPNKDKIPTENSNESNNLHNKECHSEGYHANSNDCRQFYRCVLDDNEKYIKYDYLCGEGTAWDTDIQACNHINAVKRCKNINAQDVQTTSISQNETLTTENIRTTENIKTTENIRTTEASTMAPESTSKREPLNEENCDSAGYFGNKEDCKKFYRCVDNGNGDFIKYDYICGDGTIWDQDILACNHPKDVSNPSCDQVPKNSSSTTSTTSSVQETTSSRPSSQSSTSSVSPDTTMSASEVSSQVPSNCSSEDTSKKPVNQNITCNEAGYYANPYDCKKFYRCVDWDGGGQRFSVFHFECGEGTIWDPALTTCNYEESVYPPRRCNGSQSQNSNSTLETTMAAIQENSTSSIFTETTTQTTQQTQESVSSTESTSTLQASSSESTTIQSTTSDGQTTALQPSTSDQTTSTTVASTTNTEQITSELTTTEKTSTTTSTEPTTTSTEPTTTVTEKQSSTTTDQSTTQTTESSTGLSTTTEETITSESTTVLQTSTELTTDKQSTSSTTEESTTSNTSTTTENTQATTEGSSPTDKCPETENDQYLYACPTSFKRHPKYCNLFYQCIENNDSHELKIAIFNCPNGTIYDESKIQCVEENNAEKKCQGDIAQKRRYKRLHLNNKETITVSGNKYGCAGVGHYPFEKNKECSPAFLKCEGTKTGKLRGFVFQCPENYVYWSVSRRCEPISKLRECKRSSNQWTERADIPIERRNVAH